MKTLMIFLVSGILLVGCASGKVMNLVSQAQGKAIEAIDMACQDDAFNTGFMGRIFKDKQTTINAQQRADIDYFRAVCKKPKAERTQEEYGWIAGSFFDNSLSAIIPLLGKDALNALKIAGLI